MIQAVLHHCSAAFCLATLSAFFLPNTANSAPYDSTPPVIYDNGQTESIATHYDRFVTKPPPGSVRPPSRRYQPSQYGAWLPVHTPELSPGIVEAQPLPTIKGISRRAALRPVFVVGADSLSYEWLQANAEHLVEIDAVGIVVEAKEDQELAIIHELSGQRPIFAASGSDIAKELGLRHYPALISEDGIAQ